MKGQRSRVRRRDVLTLIREVAVFRERMWSNGNIRPLRQPRADTGFSPRPQPVLVRTHKTMGEALALQAARSDRAVDEPGNQTVVGRRGARPFNLEE